MIMTTIITVVLTIIIITIIMLQHSLDLLSKNGPTVLRRGAAAWPPPSSYAVFVIAVRAPLISLPGKSGRCREDCSRHDPSPIVSFISKPSMKKKPDLFERWQHCSGPYRYGPYSYGPYTYGRCTYGLAKKITTRSRAVLINGLYSYGIHDYGPHRYGLYNHSQMRAIPLPLYSHGLCGQLWPMQVWRCASYTPAYRSPIVFFI